MVSSATHQETAPPDLAAHDAGALLPLTPDATYEVLLRLPGKSLCRLQVVCRAWRSLLSAPWFVAAHAAHNREPYYVAAAFHDAGALEREGQLVDVLDDVPSLPGRIVKPQVRGKKDDDTVVKTIELSGRFRQLNRASGAVCQLWSKLEKERAARGSNLGDYGEPVYLFGQVTGTGEHKVLRMIPCRWNRSRKDLVEVCTLRGGCSPAPAEWRPKQAWNASARVVIGGVSYFLSVASYLFGQVTRTEAHKVFWMLPCRWNRNRKDLVEVCTLRGCNCNLPAPAKWRPKQGFPLPVVWNASTRVVIGGVAYFLSVAAYSSIMNPRSIKQQGWVVRFDLEAEEWRPDIRGPNSLVSGDLFDGHRDPSSEVITLANLNGSLVISLGSTRYMDLWFLMDSEKGLWVRQYSVQVERSGHCLPMQPLVMLEDGRIVTLITSTRLLQIYDPITGGFSSLMS
ncbi:unnamed protein product [Urochloa decumbens]|uniref:F-box domain-containing protein n=1 Tax=Urochloa decumbens TaxID=240449 RepID=A0ABC9EZW4_9POAL